MVFLGYYYKNKLLKVVFSNEKHFIMVFEQRKKMPF